MILKKNVFNENFIKLMKNNLNKSSIDNNLDVFTELNLSPYLYQYSKKNNLFISDKLENIYKKNVISNIIILDYKIFLEEELKKLNIKHLFYKGTYLIENIYNSIGDRYLGDIDLLVDNNDLDKLKKVFKNDINKIDELISQKDTHESYLLIKHKNQTINIDIHKSFFPQNKYPINIDIFFQKDRVEHHIITLIIEISSEFFIDDKRFLDLILIIEKKNIDWQYLYSTLKKFRLKRASYVIFKLINENFNKNYPIITINNFEKLFMRKIISFNNKRWNQFFLFFYIFDNLDDYGSFFKKRLMKSYNEKSIYKELKKFWIKYR